MSVRDTMARLQRAVFGHVTVGDLVELRHSEVDGVGTVLSFEVHLPSTPTEHERIRVRVMWSDGSTDTYDEHQLALVEQHEDADESN